MPSTFDQLFRQVASRRRWVSFGSWFFRFTLLFASLYALLLIAARLLALIPDVYEPWTVALVPAAALLASLVTHRSIDRTTAARLIDVQMKTKDLFLTTATLATAPGEYHALIAHNAEEQARTIRPATVVPFRGGNQAGIIALSLALLVLGAWLLPEFDPFARKQSQQQIAQRIKKLEAEKQVAKEKIEALKQQDVTATTSKEVEQALAELKKTFEQMKKNEQEKNLSKLNEQQRTLSEKWKEAQEKKLKETSRDKLAQQLGGAATSPKAQEWKEDLAQGKSESLKKELSEIKELAQKAENASSEKERNEAKQEMQQRMQEMKEFVNNNAGGKQAAESLQKALEQLSQSKDPAAAEKAMEAMKESMQLSEQQIEQLSQAIRDQKSLEKAMQAIQDAKQANSKNELDGQECKDSQSLREYAEKLRQKMGGDQSASQEPGQLADGSGGKKPGEKGGGNGDKDGGKGGLKAGDKPGGEGTPAEDISGSTAFRTEKSKSALQAGKSLMQWKTQEVTDSGKAKVEYKNAVEKVKQGVSEAILQEQIPPGYHEAIQKYFDDVEKAAPAKK